MLSLLTSLHHHFVSSAQEHLEEHEEIVISDDDNNDVIIQAMVQSVQLEEDEAYARSLQVGKRLLVSRCLHFSHSQPIIRYEAYPSKCREL